MMDLVDRAYLIGALSALGLFWSAPWHLARGWGLGTVPRNRMYLLSAGLTTLLPAACLLAVAFADVDAAFLAAFGVPVLPVRAVGLALAAGGITYARRAHGALAKAFAPSPVYFRTHGICETGPYAHVRHPFYGGLWLAIAGGVLALDSLLTLGMAMVVTPLLATLAHLEEEHLERTRELWYGDYARRTPRFIPRPGSLLRREKGFRRGGGITMTR